MFCEVRISQAEEENLHKMSQTGQTDHADLLMIR